MMTLQEQRICIAEKCGWRIENYGPAGFESLYWRLRRPDGTLRESDCTGEDWSRAVFANMMPNYPQDLNAMHYAWKILDRCQRVQFSNEINRLIVDAGGHASSLREDIYACITNATSRQRAEAFCRVLWPERFK